jgi:hypothetical protein
MFFPTASVAGAKICRPLYELLEPCIIAEGWRSQQKQLPPILSNFLDIHPKPFAVDY